MPVSLGWKYPNTGATDTYGFGMLAGGWLNEVSAYTTLGEQGAFWLSNEVGGSPQFVKMLYNATTAAYSAALDNYGASVRLVMDDPTQWYEGYTMTDPSGNVYPTCKIGTQVFTAANYFSTKYLDGTVITYESDPTSFNAATDGCIITNGEPNAVGTIPYSVYDTFKTLYVKPALAWAVYTHILDRIQVEVSDRGMFQLTAQNSQVIGRNEIEAFKASIRENLNTYLEETRQYVTAQVEAGVAIYSNYYTIDTNEQERANSVQIQSNTKKYYHV
jgi:hypothetical protein